jgi:hypothetical protein
MATTDIQKVYENAIQDIETRSRRAAKLPARQQPIFQRRLPRTGQQAVQDAATALKALWKINTPAVSR